MLNMCRYSPGTFRFQGIYRHTLSESTMLLINISIGYVFTKPIFTMQHISYDMRKLEFLRSHPPLSELECLCINPTAHNTALSN